MNSNEKSSIELSIDFYHVRDEAKKIYGDNYNSRVEPFREIIANVMKANGISEVDALEKIKETELYNHPKSRVLFTSAMVDLIQEHSKF